jgi:hypothetical protein
MLFRERVAVYCENHTEHTDTLCGQNAEYIYIYIYIYISSVRTSQEILRLRYKAQPVNAV